MSEQFLGEIRLFAISFPPKGWVFCQGQTLSIAQNQALFALIGTYYGGDGVTTFKLPDLRGRAPAHVNYRAGDSNPGEIGGEATHTLTISEMPLHNHVPIAQSAANQSSPAGVTWGAPSKASYATTANTTMSPTALAQAGASQPHENMPPYLVLNYAIALTGIFPSRS